MEGLVKIKDFMRHLEKNNLVIVHKTVLKDVIEEDLQMKRTRLLNQKTVSISEIVEGKLLPLESNQGVRHWIKSGKIRPDEVFVMAGGQIKVLTSAIKRLGYV